MALRAKLIAIREDDGHREFLMAGKLEDVAITMAMLAGEPSPDGAIYALKEEHEAILRDGEYVYVAEVISD